MPGVAAQIAESSTPERSVAPTPELGESPVFGGGEANSLFDLVGASSLVAEGKALLVSIAPIKAALGPRWASRRDDVYELSERYFRKHLSDSDICVQASETGILVGTPDKSAVVAQALCYRALKEVLTHFLGAAEPAHLEVSLVTDLSGESVSVRPISVADLVRADAETTSAMAAASAPPTPVERSKAWPLITASGRDLRISFAIDPVIDLRHWSVAGHRVEPRILDMERSAELMASERRSLLPRDLEKIDLAALARGTSQLTARDAGRPSLVIQLSCVSISNGRARASILDRARAAEAVMRRAVICELVDIEPGIPFGRLAEMIALARPFFRTVWIQVEPILALIQAGREAGARGLTVRAPTLGDNPISIAHGFRRFMKMAEGAAPVVAVTGLPSRGLLMEAMAVGFSHATLRIRSAAPASPLADPSRMPPPSTPHH